MRPNVLWIVLDTARADSLEPYGAPQGSSPVIADLARRGVALQGVHSTACWTLPAHASMLAGGLPRALGLANQAGIKPHSARPIIESLHDRLIAEVLRTSGYATGAISANAWVSPQSGFGSGFDRFGDARIRRQARMSSPRLADKLRWMTEAARARADDGASDAARILRDWTAEIPNGPFFWFVNLLEAHSPYLPPRPYGERLTTRVRAAREASSHLTQKAFWRTCLGGELPSESALARMRSGYRGAVRYMDDWLGQVLEGLDRAGRLEQTLVIVTSDHGENFGEGGLLGHGFSLDQRLISLPLVAAGPGVDELAGLTSIAELPGRIATIAGVTEHPYGEEELPPLPTAQFDPPAPPPEHPRTAALIEEWQLDDSAIADLTEARTAAVDGRLKLVARGTTEAFYDLDSDPLELHALQASDLDGAAVERLRAAVSHPAVVSSRAHGDFLSDQPAPGPADAETADLEDRMRLLGYL